MHEEQPREGSSETRARRTAIDRPSGPRVATPPAADAAAWDDDALVALVTARLAPPPTDARPHDANTIRMPALDAASLTRLADALRALEGPVRAHAAPAATAATVGTAATAAAAPPRGPRFLLVHGTPLGARYPLLDPADPERPIVIGRARDAQVSIPDDATVSARHAMIAETPRGLMLRDLASRNGTTLNGERVPDDVAVPLAPGDVIGVGRTLLVYRA